jgi:hypothetical protein
MTKLATLFLGLLTALGAGCDQHQNVGTNPDAGQESDGGVEHDAGGADMAAHPKRVFISSLTYDGDLKTAGGGQTGLEGGDKLCQHLADAAVLGGAWKAWLSDATTNAIDRITEGPWYILTYATTGFGPPFEVYETKAFNNKANLTTVPLSSIQNTEFGERVYARDGVIHVWTGTTGSATRATQTCTDWSSAASSDHGLIGEPASVAVAWTDSAQWEAANGSHPVPTPCSESLHLYCFEQ